ncbi:MAG: hypothetical protein MUO19_02440, partial [Dehalococcoidales bacterium]|nr:hypothetical protein [Dehalococcoidales bacterium]
LSGYVSEHLGKLDTVKALSIGGGPGTETIALMNQLNGCEGNQNITFCNLEYEQSWEPIYLDLVDQFTHFTSSVSITPEFRQFDASAPLFQQINESDYDIVFIPWILSELKSSTERRMLLQRVAGVICMNGHLIVTDRIEEALMDEISKYAAELKDFNLIEENRDCKSHAGISFPSELLEIFKPKLSYKTAYWVLKKQHT